MTHLNTMRRPIDTLLRTQAHRHGAMCVRLTTLRPEPFPTLTGRRIAQSLSGSSIQSLRRSKRSIPLTYPSSNQVLSFHLCDEDLVEHSYGFWATFSSWRRGKDFWRCDAQMCFAPGFSDLDKYRWDSRLFNEGWCLSSNAWCANLLPKNGRCCGKMCWDGSSQVNWQSLRMERFWSYVPEILIVIWWCGESILTRLTSLLNADCGILEYPK